MYHSSYFVRKGYVLVIESHVSSKHAIICAMPRFSVNDKTVKHIKFSFNTEKDLNAYDVMRVIAQLKELEWIVCNKDLTAKDAQTHLTEMMKKQIDKYSKD